MSEPADRDFIFPPLRPRIIRRHSRIVASAAVFPPAVLSNADIISAGKLAVTDAVVRKTLGVERRHVAGEGVTDSDLLAEAAAACLAQARLTVDELSRILVTRFVGDHVLPMTASLVQRKLAARVAMHALDVEGGTNSFVHAIDLATRYISTSGPGHRILLCSGGLHRLPVSKTDPRVAFLFGDGAAALLLEPADEPHFRAVYTYSNHAWFDNAATRTLKMTREIFDRVVKQGDASPLYDLYTMGNWKDAAEFYVEAACVTQERLLAEAGLRREQIDLCLVTENNARLRVMTLERLGYGENKSLSVLATCGNTMSAMLPVLWHTALSAGRSSTGMNVMFISHGEGASGGGFIYRV